MVRRFLPVAVAFLWLAAGGAEAQDAAPELTGRIDSSYSWMSDPLPDGSHTLGLVSGWTGVAGGTRDVKSEVRLGFTNLPAAALSLQRAWVKFRFPGVRVTAGLGRLAWGTGFVLVPGDLLFGTVGTDLDFGAEELRSQGTWLGSLWMALGDEAFAEAAILKDSAGIRVSAAPGGVTLEAAAAWDRLAAAAKAAVSTQFHWGVDWYATFRQDLSASAPSLTLDGTAAGAGAFGLWTLTEGVSLTTRHEVLAPGNDPGHRWKSYHDVVLAWDGGWSAAGRLQTEAMKGDWSPSAELRWGPLQNLSLYTVGTLKAPWVFRMGAAAKW